MTARGRRFLLGAAGLFAALPAVAGGATYYVSPAGNDANPCSLALPCREIRKALTLVVPGDTILVADGGYKGFDVDGIHGAPGAPITIRAQGSAAVVLTTTDRPDNRDTIFITFSSYIVVDGLRAFDGIRAAVRVDQSPWVTVRNGVFGDNTTWGIFTDFSDDLLIEDNECYGSVEEHGIYVSNSGDRPVVRGNRVHDNYASGIQLNADLSAGGDGIITGALIEENVVFRNGVAGGAAINLDGVQDSVVRNNLLYDNHATGIVNYRGDGAAGPVGMKIQHNTVDQASDARWALLMWNTAGPNVVRNNILYNRNPYRREPAPPDGRELPYPVRARRRVPRPGLRDDVLHPPLQQRGEPGDGADRAEPGGLHDRRARLVLEHGGKPLGKPALQPGLQADARPEHGDGGRGGGQSGTMTISHDGRYGDFAGKTVALEPSTGFSFDSPMTARPR